MNRDDAMLEDALCSLAPTRLDHRLFGLLHQTLADASVVVDAADAKFEATLAVLRPSAMSSILVHSLTQIVGETPKILAMPAAANRLHSFRRYAAAAAIAVIGAAAALIAPIGGDRPNAIADAGIDAPVIPLAAAREFVPAGYARGLSEARDEGVVWKDNAPHRVLRIVYTDTITLSNEVGEIVECEQPRVEYIVIPEKID